MIRRRQMMIVVVVHFKAQFQDEKIAEKIQ